MSHDNEILDGIHVDMEKALSRNRHDMGRHDFFDRVEDFIEEAPETLEDDGVHNSAQDFRAADIHVRTRQSKVLNVGQIAVSSSPVQVTNGIDGQTSINIQNAGSSTIYVGPTAAGSQSWAGYPIAAGAALAMDYTGPLWVAAAAGNTSTAAFLILAYGSN